MCRRGRPRRNEIEVLQTKAWFWAVAMRLGVTSGYAVEKRFPTVTSKNKDSKRSCKYDKYKRGQHSPEQDVIDRIEDDLPRTKSIYEHPLWQVATCPCSGLDNIYHQLHRLRPELVDLIFQSAGNQRKPERYATIFESLGKEGDIEALTACIGLIQEAKYYGYERLDFIYTHPTFRVFCRSISERPYSYISVEFHKHLTNNILDNPIGRQLAKAVPASFVSEYGWLNEARLTIIDDFDIFKGELAPPRACLHIAEKYLTASVIQRIFEPEKNPGIYKLPELKNLRRTLKRWMKNRTMTTP